MTRSLHGMAVDYERLNSHGLWNLLVSLLRDHGEQPLPGYFHASTESSLVYRH